MPVRSPGAIQVDSATPRQLSRPARIRGILGHIGHGYRRLPVGSGGSELSELGSSLPRQRSGDDARRRRRRGARAELAEDGRGLALERVRAKGGTERSAKVDRGGRRGRCGGGRRRGSRARARLGVVEEAAALLGIPAVLDGVLGPARESARDLIPAITEDRLERHEQEVFGRRPGRLHQMRVQVILPAPVQK